MYCPHCMTENADNDTLCKKCGQKLHDMNGEHELPIGSILSGRYYVGKALRQGGFGITYVGMDEKLGLRKKIAIKEFFPSGIATRMSRYTEDISVTGKEKAHFYDQEKAKFLKEAQILAKFSDVRNVVSVTDIVSEHNTVYLIMEFLEGMDLDEYIHRKSQMTFQESFELLKPIILSLGRIHREGLIHRDISPSNIKILQDGTAILLDFGAAREFDAMDEKSMSIILKPGYAPPEQYGSRGQEKMTDVYALCATIYKMITGVTPENSYDRLVIKDTLKSPIELGADITPEQEAILMKGMAVQVPERIQSMEELYNAFAVTTGDPTVSLQTNIEDADDLTVPLNGKSNARSYEDQTTILNSRGIVTGSIPTQMVEDGSHNTKKWMPVAAAVIIVVIVGVLFVWMIGNYASQTTTGREIASQRKDDSSDVEIDSGGDTESQTEEENDSQETTTTDDTIAGDLSINVVSTIMVGDDVSCTLSAGNFILLKESEGISWSSSDKNTLRVDNGIITGVSEGSAYVYADYKGKTASARITVLAVDSGYGSSIQISADDVRLTAGGVGSTTSASVNITLDDPPSPYQLMNYVSSGLDNSIRTEWKQADDGSPILSLQPDYIGGDGYIAIYLTPQDDNTHVVAYKRISVKVTEN